MRRWPIVLLALTALTACTAKPDVAATPPATASSPTGTVPVSPTAGGTPAPGATQTPSLPPPDRVPGAPIEPTAVPSNAARLRPTAPGLYRYAVQSETAGTTQGGVQTIELRAHGAVERRGDLAQVHEFRFPDNPPLEFEYLFRDGSIAVVREHQGDLDCSFSPRPVTLLLPLQIGARWSTDTACETGDRRERTYDGEVLRAEARRVGDRRVETFVVRKRILQDGAVLDEQVQWYSPAHRLIVRIERTVNGLFSIQQLQDVEPL